MPGELRPSPISSAGIPAAAGLATERRFRFDQDTFCYPNELVWQYRFDPQTGRTTTFCTEPPPTYSHRCFVLVRATRQFFYHARFEPSAPTVDELNYRRLVRQVMARSPRVPCPASERIVFPGYSGLREFSEKQTVLLKQECGGPWQSYFLRSHWRMVFPVWRRHQERMAAQLAKAFASTPMPLVHLFRFPKISINHGIVLIGCRESANEIEFEAYDPNIPAHPVKLFYDRQTRWFHFPRTHYWAGGPLQVIEIFCGLIY